MPFDTRLMVGVDPRGRRGVALWLFGLCVMVWVMIGLGGVTRLTGSGLSIMEWAPIMGVLPPWSEAEWQRLYGLYQRIPQYELVNKGFGIEGFRAIFWLEWVHRLWGRLIGVVFVVPMGWLVWRGWIGRRLLPRLGVLLVLGGVQGGVGWVMVASGFLPESTSVSPYRLVVHLGLALGLYVALLWTGLGEWRGEVREGGPRGLRGVAWGVAGLVGVTVLAGGFVAGMRAGLIYNTFPLMDGLVVPVGYGDLVPWWRNATENVAAVQFDHRVLASLALVGVVGVALYYMSRCRGLAAAALFALAIAVVAQYALGVMVLLWVVPVALAVAHQMVAVLVLTACVVLLHATRAPLR